MKTGKLRCIAILAAVIILALTGCNSLSPKITIVQMQFDLMGKSVGKGWSTFRFDDNTSYHLFEISDSQSTDNTLRYYVDFIAHDVWFVGWDGYTSLDGQMMIEYQKSGRDWKFANAAIIQSDFINDNDSGAASNNPPSSTSVTDQPADKRDSSSMSTMSSTPSPYQGELFEAFRDGMWGFVDENDTVVFPFEYADVGIFSYDLCPVLDPGSRRWGYIDKANTFVLDYQYQEAKSFRNGLAAVKKDNMWGFIDTSGKVVIPIKYQDRGLFTDGVIPLKQNGYWGAVDGNGHTVVEFMFDTIESCSLYDSSPEISFRLGYAGVSLNNAHGVIDTKGNFILPLEKKNYSGGDMIIEENFLCYSSSYGGDTVYNYSGERLYDGILTYPSVDAYNSGVIFLSDSYEDRSSILLIADYSGEIKSTLTDGLASVVNKYQPENTRYSIFGFRQQPFKTDFTCVVFATMSKFDSSSAKYWNFVNSAGEFLLTEWIETPHRSELVYKGDYIIGGSSLYSSDGNLLFQRKDEALYFWQSHYLVSKTMIADINALESFEEFSDVDVINDNVAIVRDENEIFYGLYVKDELAYSTEYTNIKYDNKNNIFTLEKGATTSRIWVGPNGYIFKLN